MTGDNNDHRVDLGSVAAGNPLMLDGDHVTWMWDATLSGFQNNAPRLIDKSTGGVGANGWALYPINVGSVVWALAINGSEYRLDPPGHSIGTRTRGALTKEGTTRIVLRDPDQGAPYIEETSGIVPIPTATANAAIGNWNHATDRNWTGWIAHVYVWSRVLSAHEIACMRAKPYAIFKPRARRKLYLPSTFATAPTGEGQGIVVIAIAC
jgi:hypothetical protein